MTKETAVSWLHKHRHAWIHVALVGLAIPHAVTFYVYGRWNWFALVLCLPGMVYLGLWLFSTERPMEAKHG